MLRRRTKHRPACAAPQMLEGSQLGSNVEGYRSYLKSMWEGLKARLLYTCAVIVRVAVPHKPTVARDRV